MKTLQLVPPAPEVTLFLVNEYKKKWKELGFTYNQFLIAKGYQNPAHNIHGLDDHIHGHISSEHGNPDLISIPHKPVVGDLHVIVLLVDFPDLQGALPKDHYEDLLFSQGTHLTGSMADYYKEVSFKKVNISGEVYGWLRMPQNYKYYTNGNSGMTDRFNRDFYPRDARRLAEDAVNEARSQGVHFRPELDRLEDGTITALFIVHAGQGAEKLNPAIRGDHIWSHKWLMKHPVSVSPNLTAATYLMVPQDALLGVCAHELGHLAFQWQDFYDPNYGEDGDYWDGNGMWDIMASGSYAGRELRPVHPAGLHKLQHGWITADTIKETKMGITLEPVTRQGAKLLKITGPRYEPNQYLILENRIKENFDGALPGEGLLVWRVDEHAEQEGSIQPGMLLIQADGRHDLLHPNDGNAGDDGDPFPGKGNVRELLDIGDISTSFPNQTSGIQLKNITFNETTKNISLDIIIEER